MDYVTLKWIHILSSTFLVGIGVGSAFYLVGATLTRDSRTTAATARLVVIADWIFTASTAILQPVTGYLLVRMAGLPLGSPWLKWSIDLYVLAIACWLPVVWLQHRLRDVALAAPERALPARLLAVLPVVVRIGVSSAGRVPCHLLPDGGKDPLSRTGRQLAWVLHSRASRRPIRVQQECFHLCQPI